MRFDLDGLDVFFPYDNLYKEQYEYMYHLKKAIDDKGHGLLEMPTGTGKTVCLVSLITSYQYQYPQTGKLIYCTRTVPEMTKCMEEIKRVIQYRESILGPDGGSVLAICLSSRKNMCVHPKILQDGDRETVDSMCRNMTASWVRERASKNKGENIELCGFFEKYNSEASFAEIPRGIYSLDDIRDFGVSKGWCPYFVTRQLIHHANILVYNYQYMLDPKVSNIVSRELESESIVVFDEAHNIDNVCIEALSVTLDKRMIDSSNRSIGKLRHKVMELKQSDNERLKKEYNDLVRGLAEQHQIRLRGPTTTTTTSSSAAVNPNPETNNTAPQQSLTRATDSWLANPVIPTDLLEEAIPGNIRKAEHFLNHLGVVIHHLKSLFGGPNVENKTPLAFLDAIKAATGLERRSLKFTYIRLNSLLRTLEITSLDEFIALQDVANFITLVSTYLEGFAVIYEPQGSITTGVLEPLLQLACLDSSIAIKPVFERFQSVIITSGTLSPITLYPKLLNFHPIISVSLPMSIFRSCLLPLIITHGNDQLPISTRFQSRLDPNVIRNYGQMVIDIAKTVPDGICVFFTSYQYMEEVLDQWDRMEYLKELLKYKLIFLETKDVVETTLALQHFRKACDCGRGAIFFSIARGKIAEGIDFNQHYGRAVVLIGIPYQYTLSQVLKARLNYLREHYQIQDNDFLTFDALRQSSQCIGRVIRSKTDYGIVILADSRYSKQDKKSKLPPWILQFTKDAHMNLSTDLAIENIKTFLKQLGQPIEEQDLKSILYSEQEVQSLRTQHFLTTQTLTTSHQNMKVPMTTMGLEEQKNDQLMKQHQQQYQNEQEQMMKEETDMIDSDLMDLEPSYPLESNATTQKNSNSMDEVKDEDLLSMDCFDFPTFVPQKSSIPNSLFLFEDVFDI